MTQTSRDWHAEFDHDVSRHIQQGIVRAVFDGYALPLRDCRQTYEEEVQDQAWMWQRWIGIDSAMLALGKRYRADGVQASYTNNTTLCYIKHAELRIGRFIITAVSVPDREELPRSSAYRDRLCISNQLSLFSPEPDPSLVWAPVLHIPDHSTKQPGAIFIAFPHKNGYAAEHIDLLARFPNVVVKTENIKQTKMPSMRPAASERGA